MLLSIDIGNSTIGLGLYPEALRPEGLIINKIPIRPAGTAESYKKTLAVFLRSAAGGVPEAGSWDAIISSVVPALTKPLSGIISELNGKKPLVVSHKIVTGLSFEVKDPKKAGADRIANAVAGLHRCKGPVAVIDFGTATTITVVGNRRNFLGGAIFPGLHLMRRSLYAGTAKLPFVPLEKPLRAVGDDTVSSIAAGILFGTAGAVETITKRMEKELDFKLQLVLTGGHAEMMASCMSGRYELVPALTFEGLRLIYIQNRPPCGAPARDGTSHVRPYAGRK
jgi:type III pantothenate kinase